MVEDEKSPITDPIGRADTFPELPVAAEKVEAITQRDLLVWVAPLVESSDLYNSLADLLEEECERRFGGETSGAALDVLLHSGGGSADAAYHAMLILRNFAGSIRVLVPSWAKSAATLFALGADSILMSRRAQLGPLDAQIVDPRNTATVMSALDGYLSVGYVREFALQAQHQAVAEMIERTGGEMPVGELIQRGREFAQCLIAPMMAQLRPLDYGSWARALAVAEQYAVALLSRSGEIQRSDAAEIAHTLVHGYPHHEFVIDVAEVQRLLGPRVGVMAPELAEATRAIERVIGAGGDGQSAGQFIGFPSRRAPKVVGRRPEERTTRGRKRKRKS